MNRLANESSPYLRQHAHNPVDWYAWGPEALERARSEDRPILLSIGYAACHWCHVMERESFEDAETARVMNEHFVSIKVDREERPDLDAIYMSAVQAMTGHGGWPMTVFLTPEGVPFFGGTYFPPEDRHGMPSFRRVMLSVVSAYQTRRSDIERTASDLRELYARSAESTVTSGTLSDATLDRAFQGIAARYDARYGGFEGAPKFPQSMVLEYLLHYWYRRDMPRALEMAHHSMRQMARGGVYDQVGGGFHRYSVDERWLVPHFEKMLYDNALLARLGVHLWQATGDDEMRRVTRETIDWLAREMTSPDGGFYATLDADSEGEEGKFYLWSARELDELLGSDAPAARAYWGVSEQGNFEGANILNVPSEPDEVARRLSIGREQLDAAVARARATLYSHRARRIWPARDEKILAAWNGLMLRAVADAARALDDEGYRALALANGEFLFREMVRDGRVMRVHTSGITRLAGYLEDHAAVALGALALYELTFDRQWLDRARLLGQQTVRWFWDDARGAFFDTASDHETLITRPREVTDNATPSGTSLAVELLLRLAELTQDTDMRRQATRVLDALAETMARYGPAFGHLLTSADLSLRGAVEIALIGDPGGPEMGAFAREIAARYLPTLALAGARGPDPEIALLADRAMVDGRATAYVCRNYTCERPVTTAADLASALDSTGSASE